MPLLLTTPFRLLAALSFFFAAGISQMLPAPAQPTAATPVAPALSLRDAEVLAVGFTPGNADALILQVINSAQKEIRMAAYTFTSRPIADALLRAKRRGVSVFVVLDEPKKSAKPFIIPFLDKNKIPYRLCNKYGIMHNKFLVVDKMLVQTGSYNYTKAAATANAENIIVLRGAGCATLYLREWNRLWLESALPGG
jgi:phosphatidylserine/phosphatidylglycerophosphate/cardiolipin synthase-like enzyme